MPNPARTPRPSTLTALAFVVPGALSLALVLPALADSPTRASHAQMEGMIGHFIVP